MDITSIDIQPSLSKHSTAKDLYKARMYTKRLYEYKLLLQPEQVVLQVCVKILY